MSLKISNWKIKYLPASRAPSVGLLMLFIIFVINSGNIFLYGLTKNLNGTEIIQCFQDGSPETEWMNLWDHVI